jgi:hypothetical protein
MIGCDRFLIFLIFLKITPKYFRANAFLSPVFLFRQLKSPLTNLIYPEASSLLHTSKTSAPCLPVADDYLTLKPEHMKKLIATAMTVCVLATIPFTSDAGPRRWSRKGKGAAIGAATGAVVGGVAKGGKGAIIGGAAGAGAGYLIGRHKDRKHGRTYR